MQDMDGVAAHATAELESLKTAEEDKRGNIEAPPHDSDAPSG